VAALGVNASLLGARHREEEPKKVGGIVIVQHRTVFISKSI
jgi:hypothetical protein